MSSLAERVADLGRQLEYAADDDALAVEAAVLLAAVASNRARPSSAPALVRSHPPEEVVRARAATLTRYLEMRGELVRGSVSTAEAAVRLGISPAAVTKRRGARALVAFRHRGDWRYPAWQFSDGGVLPGVPQVWRELPDRDPLGLADWFTLPSRHLDGRSPLDVLRDGAAGDVGALGRVADAASYVGSR